MKVKTSHYSLRPSFVTNLGSGHGDTNRVIDFLSFRGATFGLISHGHSSNRANSCCSSSKHHVPPSIVAFLVTLITHPVLFSFNCFGSICHHQPPRRCHRRPVADGWAANEWCCHGDWCHLCYVISVLN